MTAVCCPRHLPCNPSHAAGPPPPREIFMALIVAAPAALLIFWLRRNLHRPRREQLAEVVPDQIPATATPEDLDAPAASSSAAPLQAESEGSESSSSRASDEEDVEFGDAESVAVGVEEEVGVGVEKDAGVGHEEDVGVGVGDEAGRPELTPAFINATVDRSATVAGIRDKLSNTFGGIHLDIHSCDESTIHPANGVLMQSMEIFCGITNRVPPIFGTGDYIIECYSAMFDCWVCKLEKDAEWICQGEKARTYIFLLNNTYDAWQMLRCLGASFSNVELMSRLISIIQRYKKSYLDECWVPLTNTCRLGKFTSTFHTICKRQMAWKVTAELRYTLRHEIADLILPSYEISLLAFKANQSPLSEICYWLKRSMAGKKKQKKLTAEALEEVIKELFEG